MRLIDRVNRLVAARIAIGIRPSEFTDADLDDLWDLAMRCDRRESAAVERSRAPRPLPTSVPSGGREVST